MSRRQKTKKRSKNKSPQRNANRDFSKFKKNVEKEPAWLKRVNSVPPLSETKIGLLALVSLLILGSVLVRIFL